MGLPFLAPSYGVSIVISPFGVFSVPRSPLETPAANENHAEDLAARFRPAFPQDPQSYSAEIIQTAIETPGEPLLRERLLDAYARAPASERGSWNQFHTARAIKELFRFNETPLRGLITRAINDNDDRRRLHSLSSIFRAMESGSPQTDTLRDVSNLARQGMPPEEIAHVINGTGHTADLNDLRLARRVVSVFLDLDLLLQNPRCVEASREQFSRAVWRFVRSRQPLTPAAVFALLQVNPTPLTTRLKEAWGEGKLIVEILPEEIFDKRAAAWGRARDCRYALFVPARPGRPDRFLLRDLPRMAHVSEFTAVTETARRLCPVPHEGGHWSDNEIDLNLAQTNRHERLVSEVMACFEDYRWRTLNLNDGSSEIPRRLGQTPALYFRRLVERAYF